MLETLISSRTRINLLLKFFLNPDCTSYLRELADEFSESTNGIRIELNKFQQAGMLTTSIEGNRKIFKANRDYPFYNDIRNILMKYTGVRQIIDQFIKHIGKLEKVYLSGDLANGHYSDIIDFVLVGEINQPYLATMVEKAEKAAGKKIRYLNYSSQEFKSIVHNNNILLLYDAIK
jgi:hypothetical protein